MHGYSYGEEVSQWLSKFLEKEKIHLITYAEDLEVKNLLDLEKEAFNVKPEDAAVYADYSPIMLLSEASLNNLNSHLEKPVSVRNFRPNLFVKDCTEFNEVEIIIT